MRTQNNILTLDTETVGTFDRPLVHDIGWMVTDKNFNVISKKRYLVKEFHIDQPWILKTSDFYSERQGLYRKAIKDATVEIKPWREVIKEFMKDLKGAKVMSAYNLAFDYKAINYTNNFFNGGDETLSKLIDKKTLLCIWNLACDTILDTDDYRGYATMKHFISDKGNYLSSAESCYAYLTQNDSYKEEHTALADVEIEVDILRYIVENCKGRVEYGLAYNCWKKIQK